ncbi:hypothetical protein BGW38_006914 [Lunasporangiospora selenospora]|uniref:BHLH domain-containing protein n=1 Tax=Lunasporangiospora selenospora TaxID=979761 RepID=A0A9P6KGQ9_9FUNG|nr:hypothetical protein BGW38_006914 [Lunasporangiospora selenospora]
MLPPNNSPWPGLATQANSPPSQPTASSSYPPPYYGHPPSHQQPYYPYPYGAYPPPYPPSHPYPPHPYPHDPAHPHPPTTDAKSSSTAASSSSSANAHPRSAPTAGKHTGKPSASRPPTKTFRFEGSISSETYKTTKSFDLAGVNILNRKPLDTRTALDKLQRRRETHNRVERKRRDCINQLIDDLTRLLPPKHMEEATSKCHRVNVLRGAVAHIKYLTDCSEALTKGIRDVKGEEYDVARDTADFITAKREAEAAVAAAAKAAEEKDGEEKKGEEAKKAEKADDDSAMDVDGVESKAIKEEERDEDDDDEDDDGDLDLDLDAERERDELAPTEKSVSRSTSPMSASSKSSTLSSPKLALSKPVNGVAHPPVIVTTDVSLLEKTSRSSSPSQPSQSSRERTLTLVPPPISITTSPSDSPVREWGSQRSRAPSECTSPIGSFSTSPMFPPSAPFVAGSGPAKGSSAFPPSPVSPSPSARQNPFSGPAEAKSKTGAGNDGVEAKQQLSPFLHRSSGSGSGSSPSLPPISSLSSMPRSSRSGPGDNDRHSDRASSSSPSLRENRPLDATPTSKYSHSHSHNHSHSHHRSGPTLPPLQIPSSQHQQHLHPSYNPETGSKSAPGIAALSPHSTSTSPRPSPAHHARHHRSSSSSSSSEAQPPVSPFMLSPNLSRSPSMAPQTSAPSTSAPAAAPAPVPYSPHWGHEGHHYMPPNPHGYPHPYPYPYPYHPSYGYPPHHPPPPHSHHPHHGHPHHGHHGPSAQTSAPAQQPAAAARPPPPEPIFIQEEPWNVQRKRSTSTAAGSGTAKSGTGAGAKGPKKPLNGNSASLDKDKENRAKEKEREKDERKEKELSAAASPNSRKRSLPQRGGSYDDEEGDELMEEDESVKRTKSHLAVQSSSGEKATGLGLVLNGAEREPQKAKSNLVEHDDHDAARTLTALAQNT